jgi:hypothetical protein
MIGVEKGGKRVGERFEIYPILVYKESAKEVICA